MSEASKQLVQRYYHAVLHDRDSLDALVTSDFVDHHFPPELPPGPAGVRQFFGDVLPAIFSDMRIEISQLLAEGDRVDCHFTLHARHTGPFAGITPQGRTIRCPAISTFRVADGRLAEAWELFDSGDLVRQMQG